MEVGRKIIKYIKILAFAGSLLLESALLTRILIRVLFENPASLTVVTCLKIIIVMTITAYTAALTIGAWEKGLQYILIPMPIALGAFGILIITNVPNILIVTLAIYLITAISLFPVSSIKAQLLKFKASIVFRHFPKDLFLSFAIAFIYITFISFSNEARQMFLINKVSELSGKMAQKLMVESLTIETEQPKDSENELFEGKFFLEDTILKILPKKEVATNLNIDQLLAREISKSLEPYAKFVPYLLAVFVLLLFQLLLTITNILFGLTIGLVFALAREFKLYYIEKVMVEQEVVSF